MTHQQALDGLASERYLLDEMTEVERFEFEAHYFDCVECAEDVRLGERIREEVKRGGGATQGGTEPGRPATVLTSPRWWRRPTVAAPWAVAATLALVASYQSLVTVPTLSPQAVEPVMLRGATRGATTTLTIARGQQFVALSADVVSAPQSAALSYEILDANRQSVASGRAQTPSSGAPLMLIVPVVELQRAGRYSLILRATDQNTVLGEYDFDVSY